MNGLPVDPSHPAVRDYLSLVRLQILTPLSLLINIATVAVCATIVSPNILAIARLKPTSITPNPFLIAIYVAAIYLTQIGYCVLLVLASKPETKRALTKGVGLSLVLANCVMALWAVAWVLQFFLAATILQGLLLLLLFYSNIALLVYHPPTHERPVDTALIHAPLRLFLILPLSIIFPLCLFITLKLSYHPTPPGPPANYADYHAWAGFAVVMSTNFLSLLVILFRRDVVLCIAATWIAVSIWIEGVKPAPIYIATIAFTALHPLALFASFIYMKFYAAPSPIVLQGDDALYRHPNPSNQNTTPGEPARGQGNAREVDVEALWG